MVGHLHTYFFQVGGEGGRARERERERERERGGEFELTNLQKFKLLQIE